MCFTCMKYIELHELPVHTHRAHQAFEKYRTIIKHICTILRFQHVFFSFSRCVPPVIGFALDPVVLPRLRQSFMSGLHSPVAGSKSSSRARGSPMSCGKFLFPSPYLPVPILIPLPVSLPASLPASSHLGCPISCGKFLFPSRYLPVPILEVPCHVVNSSSRLPTCQFPSWKSLAHVMW